MNSGNRVGGSSLTGGRAKIREEAYRIRVVFSACVVNRVKWAYWATHAFHAVMKKDQDGRGAGPHHVVHEIVSLKTHDPKLRGAAHTIQAAYEIVALPQ
jgi:hypothetical protein